VRPEEKQTKADLLNRAEMVDVFESKLAAERKGFQDSYEDFKNVSNRSISVQQRVETAGLRSSPRLQQQTAGFSSSST
jgi:hypothetical protein